MFSGDTCLSNSYSTLHQLVSIKKHSIYNPGILGSRFSCDTQQLPHSDWHPSASQLNVTCSIFGSTSMNYAYEYAWRKRKWAQKGDIKRPQQICIGYNTRTCFNIASSRYFLGADPITFLYNLFGSLKYISGYFCIFLRMTSSFIPSGPSFNQVIPSCIVSASGMTGLWYLRIDSLALAQAFHLKASARYSSTLLCCDSSVSSSSLNRSVRTWMEFSHDCNCPSLSMISSRISDSKSTSVVDDDEANNTMTLLCVWLMTDGGT